MASAFTYPEPLEPADCALLAVDLTLLPFVLGAVAQLQDRAFWQTDEDYYRASEAIGAFLECSMTVCLSDLMLSNDRLYRLIDAGLNGTIYSADGDPIVITPVISDVPPLVAVLPGALARLDHLELMIDALPGVLDPGWFGWGGEKATLADVVRSLRIGSSNDSTEAIDSLQEILGAGADIGAMGDLVVDALSGGVTALSEGGLLAVVAAGVVGNLAALGAISTQLTGMSIQNLRIIQSLDGGTFGPPDDNILEALRGDVPATASRNVIDRAIAETTANSTANALLLTELLNIKTELI